MSNCSCRAVRLQVRAQHAEAQGNLAEAADLWFQAAQANPDPTWARLWRQYAGGLALAAKALRGSGGLNTNDGFAVTLLEVNMDMSFSSVGVAQVAYAFLLDGDIHPLNNTLAKYWTWHGPTAYLHAELEKEEPQLGSETEGLFLRIAMDLYNGDGATNLGRVFFRIVGDEHQGGALIRLFTAMHEGEGAQARYVSSILQAHRPVEPQE